MLLQTHHALRSRHATYLRCYYLSLDIFSVFHSQVFVATRLIESVFHFVSNVKKKNLKKIRSDVRCCHKSATSNGVESYYYYSPGRKMLGIDNSAFMVASARKLTNKIKNLEEINVIYLRCKNTFCGFSRCLSARPRPGSGDSIAEQRFSFCE